MTFVPRNRKDGSWWRGAEVRRYASTSVLGGLSGALVTVTVVPLYVALDVIRNCGLARQPSDTFRPVDVLGMGVVLAGYGLCLLGPLMACLRPQRLAWVPLLVYVSAPWGPVMLMALFTTQGAWWRGPVNAACFGSLPVWHWLVLLGLLRAGERKSA